MFKQGTPIRFTVFTIILLSLFTFDVPAKKLKKKATTLPQGTPVLWQEPVDISSRDLYLGPGGSSMKPNLKRVTFIEEQKGGFSTKYRVRDGSGREWVAKVGSEAQSEIAASRLLWAVGYPTEITYLAPRVRIVGKGTFQNVRFEARPKNIKRLDEWTWNNNPFVGTSEFQGLKVMMVLMNNWDIKDENNKILYWKDPKTGKAQLQYIISDLGATFGRTGAWIGNKWVSKLTRSRNKPEDYAKSKFIDEAKDGFIKFNFEGKNKDLFKDITVEQVGWISGLLSKLTEQQIQDAFRAANYSAEDIQVLTRAVRARINELASLSADKSTKR
jgi:hypothetical protein